MANLAISLIFHIIGFLVMGFGAYYDTMIVQFGWQFYGGKYKFLTYWNLWIQTVYFGLCVFSDLLGTHLVQLKKFRNNFSNVFAFPVGNFVVLTFWIIYFIDREMVYPKALDSIIPSWLNHIMHTWPSFFLMLDKFLDYQEYPKKVKGVLGLTVFAVSYLIVLSYFAEVEGKWVYPILNILNTSERIIFLGFLFMFLVSLYILGEAITNAMWCGRCLHLRKKRKQT